MTLIIKKQEIKKVLDMKTTIDVVEKAFKAYGLGKVQLPCKSYLYFKKYKGDLRSMPAYIELEDMDIAGIKSVNVHPDNHKIGLPTVMAVITLTDPKTGYPIAVMDGTYITCMRTGAAGAIAAKYLSKEESRVAGFVGAGEQAKTQLAALMIVRPIKTIKVYDLDEKRAKEFCKEVEERYKIKAICTDSIEEAVKECDIVTTVTPTRKPIVKKEFISKGTHINAIGADSEGKQELESELTKSSIIVIDEWTQASHSGEINVPLREGVITKEDIYAELGLIVAGKKQGRTNNQDITIFDSTGLAIQDISTAFFVYNKLKNKELDINLF